MAQLQRLLSSAGLSLFHILLGTTPYIAPPSNLKKPVLMVCKFMFVFLVSKVRLRHKKTPIVYRGFEDLLATII
jgi:hypothetical protein